MNALKGLTFAAVPREGGLTPQQKRRNKLIAHMREQLAMAEAQIDGRVVELISLASASLYGLK